MRTAVLADVAQATPRTRRLRRTELRYRAALDLLANDVAVAAVVDLRPTVGSAEPLARLLAQAGVEVLTGSCIVEGVADAAGLCAGARVASLGADGKPVGAEREIACDGILMSTGWAPAANLLYQAGTRMRFDTAVEQFVPDVLPDGVFACGRVNGVFGLERKLADGALHDLAGNAREWTRDLFRDEDTVARLGGDEFVVAMPSDAGQAAIEPTAAKVVEALSQPFEVDGHVLRIACSVGVARFPNDGDTAERLLIAADHAMYRAKNAGRARWSA